MGIYEITARRANGATFTDSLYATSELALCEHKRIEDYTAAELVATAENVITT